MSRIYLGGVETHCNKPGHHRDRPVQPMCPELFWAGSELIENESRHHRDRPHVWAGSELIEHKTGHHRHRPAQPMCPNLSWAGCGSPGARWPIPEILNPKMMISLGGASFTSAGFRRPSAAFRRWSRPRFTSASFRRPSASFRRGREVNPSISRRRGPFWNASHIRV